MRGQGIVACMETAVTYLKCLDMRPKRDIKVVDILMQAGNVVFNHLLSYGEGRSWKFQHGRPNERGMVLQ